MFHLPLGLLALLALPAVVALHIFRRRFQPRVISALFLWDAPDTSSASGRKRERLFTSPSFWLELAAALLLALALAGPRFGSAGLARHLVVVLDTSASMSAVAASGESVRDRAVEEVTARIDALSSSARVTLIASGPRTQVLAGPAALKPDALAALNAWSPTAPRHAHDAAIALAMQLAGEGSVVLVTDALVEDAPPEVDVLALGEPRVNRGFVAASRRTSDEGERVELTIAARGPVPSPIALTLHAIADDGSESLLLERSVDIAPDARVQLGFDVPAGSPPLVARMPSDALALDDVAFLVPPPPRTLSVASALPAELEAHLGLGADAARWVELSSPAVEVDDTSAAHLVLATSPDLGAGSTWVLAFESPGDERRDLIGPFLVDPEHPLLAGVTLDGIVWSHAPDHALPGAPLVTAGNTVLVSEERRGPRVVIHMAYDPLRSSLHRSPDFPILLANLVAWRRAELPGFAQTNLASGATLEHRSTGEAFYVLEGPTGQRELRARDTLVVDGPTAPGLYRLKRNEVDVGQIAVTLLDPSESDLKERGEGERAANVGTAALAAGVVWIDLALIVAALGVMLLDWFVLSRNGL